MSVLMHVDTLKSELIAIVNRMKSATLGAVLQKLDWIPSVPIHPCTKWMTEDEMFALLGWKDIDDRGEAGLIIFTRGWGSDIRVDWTEAMKPDKQYEGLTKPFMRKMQTITTPDHPADEPSVVIHGEGAKEWYVVEASGDSLRGWGLHTFTSVPAAYVQAWTEGVTNMRQRYAAAVQTVPLLRDHAFMMNQYISHREPPAASEQIRQKVVAFIMARLPPCQKWVDWHNFLLEDAFVELTMQACESAMPKPGIPEINATHLARIYWIAREFVKSARLLEPPEAVPDNMFTVDLATKSMRIVLEKTAVRVNETQPWEVEQTFKEYLLTKTSMIA
jgi:hypothetical protein